MRVSLAQFNPRIGDLKANYLSLIDILEKSTNADLIVTPELATCGYPPLDLVQWPYFVDKVEEVNQKLISKSGETGLLFGTIFRSAKGLHNGAILAAEGREIGRAVKRLLPRYDVFDEKRYFVSGDKPGLIQFGQENLGVSICEDAWVNKQLWPQCPYEVDPISDLVEAGATYLINMSASPYHKTKPHWRKQLFVDHSLRHQLPFCHVNQVGANDELIFDGGSLILDQKGEIQARGPLFQSCEVVEGKKASWPKLEEEILEALIFGLKDYLTKNQFSKVILGVSGGIDSCLVLYLASKALNPENVIAVAMPGPYSSADSLDDARGLCQELRIHLYESSIESLFEEMEKTFQASFNRPLEGLARQNAQARCRGQILMNLANDQQALVLNTGNKSELAVGYCTLQGDLSGSLSVIGDLTKQEVYQLCQYVCDNEGVKIPKSILTKPPSAELSHNQKDQDTLPDYEFLDQLVVDYVEKRLSPEEMNNKGLKLEEIYRWIKVINANEYKRWQAPPIFRITQKAFGRGRRYPLTQSFDPQWSSVK